MHLAATSSIADAAVVAPPVRTVTTLTAGHDDVGRLGRPGGVAGEEDRRPAGIGRRRHPGVDAGDGARGGERLRKAAAILSRQSGAAEDEADDEERRTARKRNA